LANGGYAPTIPAWELANQQVNGNYGVDQLGASLREIKRAINYRLQNIPGMTELGAGAPNRYIQGQNTFGGGRGSEAPADRGPQPGDIESGFRFKGGNPADQKNWEPAT
jgi:hypothetical protein